MAVSSRDRLIGMIARLNDEQIEALLKAAKRIESKAKPRDTLEELLSKVTPENLHGEIDWGHPYEKNDSGKMSLIDPRFLG